MKNKKRIFFCLIFILLVSKIFSQESLHSFLEKLSYGNYVINFYCDVLKSGNRDTLHKFSDIYVDKEIPDPDYGVWKLKWYDKDCLYFETIDIRIDNYTSDIDDTFF